MLAASRRVKTLFPQKRHKTAGRHPCLRVRITLFSDKTQVLLLVCAYRNDQPSSLGQLGQQGRGDVGSCSSDQNAIVGSMLRLAKTAVAGNDLLVVIPQLM